MFAMQSHWGNIKNCDCIAQFFLRARIVLQSENQAAQKNAHNHGEMASTNAGSNKLTKLGGSANWGNAPPLGTIKDRCPDSIAIKHIPSKNTHFHPNL